MLLAEMIASGELQSLAQPAGYCAAPAARLEGDPARRRCWAGHVVLHEPRIIVKQLVAEDVKGR